MRLVLASSSPRRQDLLRQMGLSFEVEAPGVDETRLPDEPAVAYVERVARTKALSVSGRGRVVVAADTAVVHAGRILGKPAHPEEARAMLRRLEGESHDVVTGLAVAGERGDIASMVDTTEVTLLALTDSEIADYVDSGEAMGKAGAYALQGAGGRFVEKVHGSPFTVIGMPIHLLPRLLDRVGVGIGRFVETRHDHG